MKKIFLLIHILVFTVIGYAQDNTGTPYSQYGLGLFPENAGPFTGMGGVAAAMRSNSIINYLNPASYTALDSNRFYFQFGINGEYSRISTHQESSKYKVAQNASLNMALRLYRNLYASFGFNELSDIGYDLLFIEGIAGDENVKFSQHMQGEGGLNDIYFGLGWKYKNLSLGFNAAIIFGKLEKRQTLQAALTDSYVIKTSENIRVSDGLFTLGAQYLINLSPKSKLTLGSSFNFGEDLRARKVFQSYKVNSNTGNSVIMDDETLKKGHISYPFKILSGFNFSYKNRWELAGDYTFQKMEKYKEFKKDQRYNNYHKASLGASYTPERYGRFWWQRNRYMLGTYFVNSFVNVKNTQINTYALTLGTQIPFVNRNGGELLLGVSFDFGVRGTEKNGLMQEKFGKVRISIAFKEFWFMKQKIN